MGKVWRAQHTALKRDDAVNVLPDAGRVTPRCVPTRNPVSRIRLCARITAVNSPLASRAANLVGAVTLIRQITRLGGSVRKILIVAIVAFALLGQSAVQVQGPADRPFWRTVVMGTKAMIAAEHPL